MKIESRNTITLSTLQTYTNDKVFPFIYSDKEVVIV